MPDLIGSLKKLLGFDSAAERGTFDEGSFTFRFFNSRSKLPAGAEIGVVPLNVAVDSIYRFAARAGLNAMGEAYRAKIVQIQDDLTEIATKKVATKVGAKAASAYLASVWNYRETAQIEEQIEQTIRAQGLRTMKELIENRAVGHKPTKIKTFHTRRGAPPIT